MASGYRPSSKDRSTFKNRNTGDGGQSQLRQRDQQVIQGMQQQRDATERIHGDKIAALRRVHQSQEINRADIKRTIEDQSYQNRRDAIQKNRDLEYQALMQKAKEFGNQSQVWQQLAPSLAEGLSKVGNSYVEQAQARKIAQAHKDGVASRGLWSTVQDQALKASDLDAMADAMAAKNKGLTGLALVFANGSPWSNVGVHNVHARRAKATIDQDLDSFLNSLKRGGVTVDSTNTDLHIENFRALNIKVNGWTNSTAKGVSEWNEALTAKGEAMKRKFINAENQVEGERGYKRASEIAKSEGLDEHNIGSLVQRQSLVLTDGKLPNMAESIEKVFVEDLAKDLTVPLNDIYNALDFLTPEQGRQEKYPTYGSRNAALKEKIRVARAEAGDTERKLKDKENKYKDSVEKEKAKAWLSHTKSYDTGGENEGKGWSGDGNERQQKVEWAKQLGLTETATLLESYAPFDETQYTKGLQLKNIEDLIKGGSLEKALNIIENSPLLTTEDRNEAKAKHLKVLQHFAQAGTSEKKIEDQLESILLINVEGTYVGNEGKTNIPSLGGAVTGGKAYLMDRFRHHDKLQPDTPEGYSEALKLAWGDTQERIDKNEGFAHVTKGLDSKTDKSYYTKYEPTVNTVAIKADEELTQVLKSNPVIKDADGQISSLGAWETEEILSTDYLHSIATDLNEGRPIVVPGKVLEESIRSGVPVDILINAQLAQKRKRGDKEASFTQRMQPGPRDIAMEGVFPGYMNVKDRIAHAHGLLEVQNLVNFSDTGGNQNLQNRDEAVNNATQFTPEDLAYIESEVQKAVDRSFKEEFIVNGNTKFKWAEIKSVCQECNLEDVDFSNVENNRYKFKPGSMTLQSILEAMGRGQLTGVYYNPVTQDLLLEDD